MGMGRANSGWLLHSLFVPWVDGSTTNWNMGYGRKSRCGRGERNRKWIAFQTCGVWGTCGTSRWRCPVGRWKYGPGARGRGRGWRYRFRSHQHIGVSYNHRSRWEKSGRLLAKSPVKATTWIYLIIPNQPRSNTDLALGKKTVYSYFLNINASSSQLHYINLPKNMRYKNHPGFSASNLL